MSYVLFDSIEEAATFVDLVDASVEYPSVEMGATMAGPKAFLNWHHALPQVSPDGTQLAIAVDDTVQACITDETVVDELPW